MAKRPRDEAELVSAAFGELAGAALVLDRDLRVVLATPMVEALLGFSIAVGESAPRALCGGGVKRPLAEALSAGTPVRTTLANPGRPGRLLSAQGLPFGEPGRRDGSVVLLAEVSAAEAEGAVLYHGMWTQERSMKEVFRVVSRVAAEDVAVLVRGETGVGKELVAQAIHALSPRHRGPFRAINCAALPANLLESELFGHTRGAFTGAVKDAPGHFQLASGGTLFLDEVAELSLELQAKLLRVLETHTVLPVGGRHPLPVDVRIVSATHRPLRKEVEAGRFRADLMYRLRVIPIFLPPLRERPGDVRLLTEKLVEQMNASHRRQIETISPSALDALEAWEFPGNVRELKNVLAYAYAIGDGPILAPSDLPPELFEQGRTTNAPNPDVESLTGEARRIARVLERVGGNRERAAKVLGWSRVTLWRRMRALGLTSS
ncbi:MAG: sigma 54-interacting transcriptional regulator [Myxococcales bacterium]|nr:sigma 54-interacting transcriptional regulator [Myxococcales bacterium]